MPRRFAPRNDLPAFTLAEVLITLGIIGIVAALTIPNLSKSWEEKAIISKYKKMYSTLATAFNMAIQEHGEPQYWDVPDKTSLLQIIEPYLNVSEKCYGKPGCISLGDYVSLTGEDRYGNLYYNTAYPKLRLNGGFGVALMYDFHPGCEYNVCVVINGTINNKKGLDYKNRLGKDHFHFVLTKQGLFPDGYSVKDEDLKIACNKTNLQADTLNKNTNGSFCGTWIQRFDNMDYLYK